MNARSLEDRDLAHLWHPFTHHGLWGTDTDPVVVIERAEGNELVDTNGNRYLDAISSLWCNTLGHRNRDVDEAVRAQLDRVAHTTLLGLSSRPAIELAEILASLCPGDLDRIFYSDAGATAVEIALKISAQHARLMRRNGEPQRTRFLTLDGAYHGDTIGAVSLGFTPWFHRHFDHLLFSVDKLPSLDFANSPRRESREEFDARVIEEAVRVIHSRGPELCAVVIEPVMQGAAGMIAHPTGFLSAVRRAASEVGALLVCDEVATGFWRTGARFACMHEGVVPDILCVAKGLSAGYLPLAATIVRPHVFEPFREGGASGERTFFHGHTYTGNALASAAAIAGLRALEALASTGRIERGAQKIASLLEPLETHPHVLEVRQRGWMIGVELTLDRAKRRAYDLEFRVGHRVAQEARKRGVMLRPIGHVMILMPPFSFTDHDLERTVRTLADAIDVVCSR